MSVECWLTGKPCTKECPPDKLAQPFDPNATTDTDVACRNRIAELARFSGDLPVSGYPAYNAAMEPRIEELASEFNTDNRRVIRRVSEGIIPLD